VRRIHVAEQRGAPSVTAGVKARYPLVPFVEDGLSKRDIIRCLKRFIAREAYGRIMVDFRARTALLNAT
jgi:hypothetical protein